MIVQTNVPTSSTGLTATGNKIQTRASKAILSTQCLLFVSSQVFSRPLYNICYNACDTICSNPTWSSWWPSRGLPPFTGGKALSSGWVESTFPLLFSSWIRMLSELLLAIAVKQICFLKFNVGLWSGKKGVRYLLQPRELIEWVDENTIEIWRKLLDINTCFKKDIKPFWIARGNSQ